MNISNYDVIVMFSAGSVLLSMMAIAVCLMVLQKSRTAEMNLRIEMVRLIGDAIGKARSEFRGDGKQ